MHSRRKRVAQGSALCALILAATALFTSVSSAKEFHSEVSSTTLSGSQVNGPDEIVFNAGALKCNEVAYSGNSASKTLSETTLTPLYSECSFAGFSGATVSLNGCTYRVTPEKHVIFEVYLNGTLTIVCPEGKKIEVVAKLAGVTKCTAKIAAQALGETVLYLNQGSGSSRDMKVTFNVLSTEGIAYSQVAGSGIGACKTESAENGSYDGELTLKGFEGINQYGIWTA